MHKTPTDRSPKSRAQDTDRPQFPRDVHKTPTDRSPKSRAQDTDRPQSQETCTRKVKQTQPWPFFSGHL
ncbi:hypothetical protein CesoFtcFv8_001315 [Champsocephalus esox]|uniref:Uncharacterized protein n=1 Tax=Champsocephalus esox TaxID=159716 RepID=A0AAN8D5P0_9TELE|nr:hypothetical protein CesoFtcFv8_001315 [Champsocephalus esox]